VFAGWCGNYLLLQAGQGEDLQVRMVNGKAYRKSFVRTWRSSTCLECIHRYSSPTHLSGMKPNARQFCHASLLAVFTAILSLAFQLQAIATAAAARPPAPIGWKTVMLKNSVFGSSWHEEGEPYRTAVRVPVYAQAHDTVPPPPLPQIEEHLRVVKSIPTFPGCGHLVDKGEQQQCSNNNLLAFIYDNLKYPEPALRNKEEGEVLVQFIVELDGTVQKAQVVPFTKNAFGKEGLRLIRLMRTKGYKWNPGPPFPPPPPPPVKCDDPVLVVEEMPLFPGCEEMGTYAEKRKCADRKMMEFIYGNIRIPPVHRQNSLAGTTVVSFVIERDGSVGDIKVVRGVSEAFNTEAVRVVNLINEKGLRFNPGKSGGRPQRVRFNLPIRVHRM